MVDHAICNNCKEELWDKISQEKQNVLGITIYFCRGCGHTLGIVRNNEVLKE
jgi:hypothetical protein